ncbi:putative potassium transport system protein Kup [Trichinella spiralis]|uniref:Potassium transport system protein Kup n=1 Tax=Trichinella spiralis TaxID=6334 RepID=A0ABR3KN73_TRISP
MDRSKLDPEILNENTLKTPDLDDHQLEADKKQVESNEDGKGQPLKQLTSEMEIMSYYLFFISEEAVELGRDF